MKKQILMGCSILALVACSSSNEEEEQKIDYASFDAAAVEEITESGDFALALEILKGQEELGLADKKNFLKQAEIYGGRLDGVATEVAIEKAREKGAGIEETALSLSKALLAQGKYEEALITLDDSNDSHVMNIDVLLLKADIANAQGDAEKAREYFKKVVAEDSNNKSGHLGLALLELEQGNFEQAETHADEAYLGSGQDPLIDYVKGSVFRYQRRVGEAIEYLERATNQNAGHVPALLELAGAYIENNELDKAREQLDAAFDVTPGNPMLKYYDGLMYAIEGKQSEAEEMLLKSEDLIKTYPPATRTYAHVSYRLGKCENAQPYFERFLDHMPNDKMTVLALADCYTRMGKPERALAAVQPILEANPDDMGANLQAAGAAGLLRDLRDAKPIVEKTFKLAVKDESVDIETRKMLGRRFAYLQYVTGELKEALASLDTLLMEYGDDTQSLILLSNIYMETGELSLAEQTTQKLFQIIPESVEGLNTMGAIRFRQRQLVEAVEYYNRAIEISPRYQSALKNRALALIGTGEYSAAKDDLIILLAEKPNDGELRGLMGRVYLEQQEPLEAMKQLKQAHSAAPKSAVIAADYALALARSGYVASAISQAQKAKKLVTTKGEKIKTYLDGLITDWEQQELERRAQSEADKARIQEEIRQKLNAEEKAKREAKEKVDGENRHR